MPPARWTCVSIVLILLVLAACDSFSTLPIFPTPTPSPVPSPTPTRADETVIPFQLLASNDISPLTVNSPGGEPLLSLKDGQPAITNDLETLAQREPTVLLVNDVEEARPLAEWLPREILTRLAEVDYSSNVAVVYALGLTDMQANTHVQRVATSHPNELTVYSVLYVYNYSLAAETFPSQVITISREEIPFKVTSDTAVHLEIFRHQVNPVYP